MLSLKTLALTGHNAGFGSGATQEGVHNLVNSDTAAHSKFCAPKQNYFFNLKLESSLTVIGFGIRSANDYADRDPHLFSLTITDTSGDKKVFKYEN